MFGLFGSSKSTPRNPYRSAQEAYNHVGSMWNSSDVEKRVKLLGNIDELADDRIFLALVHAPWSQLPESTRAKIFGTWCRRDVENHRVELAARGIGDIIAEMRFSEALYDTLFCNQEYH